MPFLAIVPVVVAAVPPHAELANVLVALPSPFLCLCWKFAQQSELFADLSLKMRQFLVLVCLEMSKPVYKALSQLSSIGLVFLLELVLLE